MLSETILETLKYFDVQDHPLTLLEISNFLLAGVEAKKASLLEILNSINSMRGKIGHWHGFYFLKGRQEIAEKRWKNNYYSTPRLNRAAKYLKRARHIPFISAVAVSGSEGLNNSKLGSDIDLLILTEKNRMWLGRFFITAYFQVLGMRRHGAHISDRFCLNHYIEKNKVLDNDQNLYTAIEYAALIPFYGGKEIFRFQKENENWINSFLLQPSFMEYQTPGPSLLKKRLEKVFSGKMGDLLERWLGRYQLKRIQVQDFITVEKDELSFHPDSKGQQVLARFKSI